MQIDVKHNTVVFSEIGPTMYMYIYFFSKNPIVFVSS